MAKISQAQKTRDYIAQNPDKKVTEVAKELGLKYQFVYVVKRNMDKKVTELRNKGHRVNRAGKILMEASVNPPTQIEMFEPTPDPVNHPAHYKYGGIETIDFIEAKELGYNLGNVIKYITRADHKGSRKEDLLKAQWYLTREINSIK